MARQWLVITVTDPSPAALDAAAEGFFAFGATAVEGLDGAIRTWLPADEDGAKPHDVVQRVLAAAGIAPSAVQLELRHDEDWLASWRRGLEPRRVGDRVVVAPSWSEPTLRDGDVLVTVDPQMAFGTGEHASTRGVLRLMQQLVRDGDAVLDVGTGSAVLAIAAVLLGAREASAVDGDADALINAAENVERNGVSDRVVLQHAWVDEAFLELHAGTYDVILANVLSSVLLPLLPAFRRALRDGGRLVLAGILQSEAGLMRNRAAAAGFTCVAEDREEEWWCGHFATPAPTAPAA
jgi:ribosomal protein L11 methyltransferase